jgi:hypothetical protein
MEYENQMVVGAAAEYERQNPEMTREQMDRVHEAATDAVCEKKWWAEWGLPDDLAEDLAYLCMAVANNNIHPLEDDADRMMKRAKWIQKAAFDWQVENG